MKRSLLLFQAAFSLAAFADAKIVNGDFEEFGPGGKPLAWYLPSKFKVVKGAGSNGSTGLVYENTSDSEYYQIASQKIEVEPGGTYRFGAWVRVDELSGKGGVGIVLGWHDKDGKWMGETQTQLLKKPSPEWTLLDGITRRVPEGAASGNLGFVVQRGALGRVAFDKAFAERHIRRPVTGVYCSAYRNEASSGDVRFAAALTPEAFGPDASKAKASFEVTGPGGERFSVPADRPSPDMARASIPAERFAAGTSEVACVVSANGRELGRDSMRFTRRDVPLARKVSIDRFGRTVVDGKPFFPLGMYTGRMSADDVAAYRESDFNCLMQYGSPTPDQMKLFEKAGLKVIYDIASQYKAKDAGTNHVRNAIAKFGSSPALLAWYLFDEKPTSTIPVLADRQRLVESLDPDHPTWCAQDIFSETRHYICACDVFGGDPYPVSKKPVSAATEAIREETKGLMGMRPIWQVVQAFGWNWINENAAKTQRRPSEAEIRNMAWQAVAGGARGLVFYNFGYYRREMERREPADVLWAEMKRIAAELASHQRVLLFSGSEGIPPEDLPDGVTGRVFSEGGETWRLLVNTTDSRIDGFGIEPLGVKLEETCGMQNALLRGEADREVAFYRPGEEMTFTLRVDGVELEGAGRFFIDWKRSGDDGKSFGGRHPVKDGPLVVKTSLDRPGFVRILAYVVDEKGTRFVKTGRNLREAKYVFFDGGAGVEPEKLDVCVPEPADFDAFWARHKAELDKVPVRAELREIPYGDKRVKVYAASIDCAGPRPATGYLTVPVKPGKYPIHISLDGYGYHYTKWPRVVGGGDVLGFNLNAHGYEIGREDEYYKAFYEATKSNGMTYGFDPEQNKDPETSYFSGMTWRLMRALQYLKTRPEWDGARVIARGGSQGGLQTVWAAALDHDVTEARIGFPWLCDMSGKDLGGRIADSWRIHWSPGLGYYDPVSLAKRIPRTCRVDIWRAGLGDYCCPPSGVSALYNAMKCPKKIRWVQGSTHNYEPPVPRQEFTLCGE